MEISQIQSEGNSTPDTMPFGEQWILRRITPEDNASMQALITRVVKEHGCDTSEYVCGESEELENLYTDYQQDNARYYVIVEKASGTIVGGGGFAPLNGEPGTCEIQKMYFDASLRGHGLGKALLMKLIQESRQLGFKNYYLETMPNLTAAIGLYKSFGFEHIPTRMGNTGHESCTVFMSRDD